MADQKILSIPIDSAEFDAFVDRYNQWNKKLESMPDAWAGTSKAVRGSKNEYKDMDKAFGALVKKATDGKFDKASKSFGKTSKDSEKSWSKISKEIEFSVKSMEKLARMGTGFSGLLKGLGTIGAIGGTAFALFDALRSTSSTVAAQNKSAKSLGLDLGKEQAFGVYGKSLGLSRDDLEAAENAKQDVTQRVGLYTAGVSDSEIDSQDAAELAWTTARAKAKQYSEWEKQPGGEQYALTQAQANGWGDSPDELRLLAKNYDEGHIDDLHKQYQDNWKKMGVDQADADKATEFDTHQSANWEKIEKSWHEDIIKLTPSMDAWSDAATNLATKLINNIPNAVDGAGKLVTQAEKNLEKSGYKGHITHDPNASFFPGLSGIENWWNSPDKWGHQSYHPDKSGLFTLPINEGDDTGGASAQRSDGSPFSNLMDAVQDIESSNNPTAVNKKTGAAGLMGIMPDNYTKAGIDPFDPVKNRQLGEQIFNGFYVKYHDFAKAAAAYDGDTHIDADSKKYGGDWLQGAKPETIDYLKKLENRGQGLDLTPDQRAYIDAHTSVKATAQMKAATQAPDNIDGFGVVPYDGDSVDQSTAADAARLQKQARDQANNGGADANDGGATLSQYMRRLHEGFSDIGNTLRDGGGSQFRSPDQSRSPQSSNLTPTNVQVSLLQPAGSDIYVSGATIPT